LLSACRKPLGRGVQASRADYYVKRHSSLSFALALVGYFLLGLDSLRQLRLQLAQDQQLAGATQLRGISEAQLPKLLHARPPALWSFLLVRLLSHLPEQQCPPQVKVMDTSFFVMGSKLFARRYQGACTPHTAGFKLGATFDPRAATPLRLEVQAGQGNDVQFLAALVPPAENIAGQMYLFDRGFRCYAFFDELMARGADFITRAGAQIVYEVLDNLPLDPRHPQILADQLVLLGGPRTHMRHPLRRVVLQTAQGPLVFLSSAAYLTAFEVTEVYRRRWNIEVFFRWLKSAMGCVRSLGYSVEAAQHTLFAALVAYLLVLRYDPTQTEIGPRGRLRGFKRALLILRIRLHQPTPQSVQDGMDFL